MAELLESWMARLEAKVDGLRADVAALKAVQLQVEDHQERIYGNGQPGIIKDVDRLKQSSRKAEKDAEQARRNFKWIIAAVLIPGVAAAAELIRSIMGG